MNICKSETLGRTDVKFYKLFKCWVGGMRCWPLNPPTPSLDGGARRVEPPAKVGPKTSKTRFPGLRLMPPTLPKICAHSPRGRHKPNFSHF